MPNNAPSFSYLSQVFMDWHDQKFRYYGEHIIETMDDGFIDRFLDKKSDFIQKLDLTLEEFRQNFIEPYLRLGEKNTLSLENLVTIADIQSKTIGHWHEVFYEKKTPLFFRVEQSSFNYFKALEWTVVNVAELGLRDFQLLDGDYSMSTEKPILQCRYCGQLGQDPRNKVFDKKSRFCHAKGCKNSALTNPEYHKKCCFGEWGRLKKTFKQHLNRNQALKHEVKRLFIEFCEERLTENLKIPFNVNYSKEGDCYD